MTHTPRRPLLMLFASALIACGAPMQDEPEPTTTEAAQELDSICPAHSLDGCANQPRGTACVKSTGAAGTCLYAPPFSKFTYGYCSCY